ncbi:MAG: nucleotidyltransferase domain-containing protein [Alteromonadaceae bacterium]|nr:nucleotidyltransferase domain-containing protein [Alteromonadaceae bacterium]
MVRAVDCGLKPDVVRSLQQVFAQFPVIDHVLLYGSRAKGNFRNGSDIDLTILLKPGAKPGPDLYAEISECIESLDLIYTIDLSFFSEIKNPALVDHIERVGVRFYP